MYEYIKGTVAEVAPAYAVIDVGGVGYYLHISLETYSAIEHETETRLYVHYVVREDAQLQMREDSIVNAVECARQQLREDPANRQRYSQEILELESRIFEVRNAKGRLIDKINTIEQEWVLANLNGAAQQPAEPAAESPAGAIPDSLKVRNLVFNPYFREQLPEADYAALRRAQGLELDAVDYVNRYFANYGTIRELAEAYAERYALLKQLADLPYPEVETAK